MTDDFIKWLDNNPSIKTDYHQNPSWQERIFIDYQIETAFNDFQSWLNWALKNENLAKNHFPYVFGLLEKAALGISDFQSATLIQKITQTFPANIIEAKHLLGPAKLKFIKAQIEIISLLISDIEIKSDIEKHTFENFKEEIHFQMKYWKDLLDIELSISSDLVDSSSKVERVILSEFEKDQGWSFFFPFESDFQKLLYTLVSYFRDGKNLKLNDVLRTKQRTKVKLARILGTIHRELGEVPLQADKSFLNIIRQIDQFKNDIDLPKTLTRNR